jgi:dolichol-phosphate mannosyltransferase
LDVLERDRNIIRMTRPGQSLVRREIFALIRFGLVGALGNSIMLGITYTLTQYAGVYYLASYGVGFSAGVLASYSLNTLWSFRQKVKIRALCYYIAINFFTIIINTVIVFVATFAGLWYIYSALIGVFVAF